MGAQGVKCLAADKPIAIAYMREVNLLHVCRKTMLVGTPLNVFARRYGEYMYLFNQNDWRSALLSVSELFDPLFDRHPTDIDYIAKVVARKTGVAESGIKCDIIEIVNPLVQDGYLVCGDGVERVDGIGNKEKSPRYGDLKQFATKQKWQGGISDDKAESGQDSLLAYFAEHPTPFELCIDLTQACTARCVHCYASEFEQVSLPFETVRKVLQEFKRMGGLKVKFTGGECMLHKNFVDILEEASVTDLVISVLSNLSVCGAKEIDVLKRCNVAVVQCSLYGADAKTHEAVTRRPTFAATIQAVRELRTAGVPVQIHCPVMRQNIDGIDEVLKFGKDVGIKVSLAASIMSRANHDTTNQECELSDSQLREFMRKYDCVSLTGECEDICVDKASAVCGIGTSKLCLSALGVYYPCNGCYDYSLGTCQSSLEEIWNGEPIRRLRAIKWKDMLECGRCKDIGYCSVCPSRNYNATKDFLKPDPAICRMARIRHSIARGG